MILEYNINKEDFVFGLDIGTRKVMGVLGFQRDDDFIVIDSVALEHESRAMIDGQIHDIHKVANSVIKVKNILEEKTGLELTEVSIAAAGRLLSTYSVKIELTFDEEKEIQKDIIKELELKGISEAQAKIKEEFQNSEIDYFSVGYSVVNYYLDDYMISKLEGHRARKIAADVLVTFLPKAVVDSLYSVMDRVGLEVTNLTLEPIAAINVAIPEELRLLNLALVDIGAGTSDIAVTKDGAVIGYGMIPIAGDEITEQIVHKYLVDFHTAEEIKFKIGKESEITFKDIMGLTHTVSTEELLEVVKGPVYRLAEEISEKVCEVNGNKKPNAIFCVGGGSQVIGLTKKISEILDIPNERVAVKGGDSLINVKYQSEFLKTPDVITPIGICVTSLKQRGYDFIKVNFNREEVKLLNAKRLTVLDVCMQKGLDHTNLIGRKGASLFFKLNNERKRIKGGPAEPAELLVNGREASLDTLIHDGDDILVQAAVNGDDARAFVRDFIDNKNLKRVLINGAYMELSSISFVNGKIADKNQEIFNDDDVMIIDINTIADLCEYLEVTLDDKEVIVNKVKVDSSYLIKDGDSIEFKIKENNDSFTVDNSDGKLLFDNDKNTELSFFDNKSSETLLFDDISSDDFIIEDDRTDDLLDEDEGPDFSFDTDSSTKDFSFDTNSSTKDFSFGTENSQEALIEDKKLEIPVIVTVNGEEVIMKSEKKDYIFVDIFNFIDFDLSHPQGNIVLKLNGNRAAFTDSIRHGDIIEIYWDKSYKVENI